MPPNIVRNILNQRSASFHQPRREMEYLLLWELVAVVGPRSSAKVNGARGNRYVGSMHPVGAGVCRTPDIISEPRAERVAFRHGASRCWALGCWARLCWARLCWAPRRWAPRRGAPRSRPVYSEATYHVDKPPEDGLAFLWRRGASAARSWKAAVEGKGAGPVPWEIEWRGAGAGAGPVP